MPDYYTTFTAEETIKCSEEEFNALVKSIGIEKGVKIGGGEALTATHEESALSVEFSPKENELYIYGEQNASVDAIPAKFVEELGKLLKIRKLPFLEFGVAFTCSKAGPGAMVGMPSASLTAASWSWPSGPGPKSSPSAVSFQITRDLRKRIPRDFALPRPRVSKRDNPIII